MKSTDATAGTLQQSDVQASPDLIGGRVGERQSSRQRSGAGQPEVSGTRLVVCRC